MRDKHQKYASLVLNDLDLDKTRKAKISTIPFLCSPELQEEIEEIVTSYYAILEFIIQEFQTNDFIQHTLDFCSETTEYLKSLSVYDKNLAAARLDMFRTVDNDLKIIESNCEIPGASEECFSLEKNFIDVYAPDHISLFPRLNLIYNTLLQHYKIQCNHFGIAPKNKLNICIAQWECNVPKLEGEYNVLMQFIREKGHACFVLDPNKITISDNTLIDTNGNDIDLVYRRFSAEDLPNLAVNGYNMAIEWDRSRTAIVNPFCTKIVDTKNVLILLRHNQFRDIIPAHLHKSLDTILGYLPWTEKIGANEMLLNGQKMEVSKLLIENKNDLVIKHVNSFSSKKVYIGIDLSDSEWLNIVHQSITGEWIAQERLKLPVVDIEYWEDNTIKKAEGICDICPYIYGGQFGGILSRASTSNLTSVYSDAIVTIRPFFLNPSE